jgi:hypothetical protein
VKARMVRYRVKPDRVAENEERITQVFEQLAREKPEGLRYASFKLEDGVTFVHVALDEELNGGSTLRELPAFKTFSDGMLDRCEEAPVVSQLTVVGSYVAEPTVKQPPLPFLAGQ